MRLNAILVNEWVPTSSFDLGSNQAQVLSRLQDDRPLMSAEIASDARGDDVIRMVLAAVAPIQQMLGGAAQGGCLSQRKAMMRSECLAVR